MLVDRLLESHVVPDFLIRWKIRRLLRARLKAEQFKNPKDFLRKVSEGPIAVNVQEANNQHYEVPADFFKHVLGPRMKYSSAYFASAEDSLETAENQMLEMTCQRAEIENGQSILELGCGWGSLTFWMAEKFPRSPILAVSNSRSQREFIEGEARRRGLSHVKVQTCDMNTFESEQTFDRIVSVEMFEHMRNLKVLFEKLSRFMNAHAKLFVHIFSHSKISYLFEDHDDSDWMSRHFFSGGMMPSHDLYQNFNQHIQLETDWKVSGTHYARTAGAWLRNMDRHREQIMPILRATYGADKANLWWERWRVFLMACEELWAFNEGHEWHVSHYLFRKARRPSGQ